MPEPPFTITRRGPTLFEAINGGGVFTIAQQPATRGTMVCSYGDIAKGPGTRIKWGNVPIAIRRAARAHFAEQWRNVVAA